MTKPLSDEECEALWLAAPSLDETWDLVRFIHAAGFEAGRAAVPREPDEDAITRGVRYAGWPNEPQYRLLIRQTWQAMYDAATGQSNATEEPLEPDFERVLVDNLDKLAIKSPSSAAPDVETMLKHSRKQLAQRTRQMDKYHANETLSAATPTDMTAHMRAIGHRNPELMWLWKRWGYERAKRFAMRDNLMEAQAKSKEWRLRYKSIHRSAKQLGAALATVDRLTRERDEAGKMLLEAREALAYVRRCRYELATIEACARVCDELERDEQRVGHMTQYSRGREHGAEYCAAAIRALAEEPKQEDITGGVAG